MCSSDLLEEVLVQKNAGIPFRSACIIGCGVMTGYGSAVNVAKVTPGSNTVVLGVGGVMGLLVGGLTTGFCVAVFMANAGGAWDNAKKHIESGVHGGKGTEAHKAAVVGDTVGDPFKDTSGPSLNILVKLMSMVSVVVAGLIVRYSLEALGIF